MNRNASGLKRASARTSILGLVYILLVLLIVTVEVVWGETSALAWAYLASSLAYLSGVFFICFRAIAKTHVALLTAIIAIFLGLLAGLILGVNYKLMIGGNL